jgi:acyl carrier protein
MLIDLASPSHSRHESGARTRMNDSRRPILRWLTTRVASYLERPASAVDAMVPLAEMGVDSVHAISLVGDVEAHFDIDVDPTMIFDYPTLAHIAEYISTAIAERQDVA